MFRYKLSNKNDNEHASSRLYIFLFTVCFNLGIRTSTEVSQGINLEEGLPLKCSYTFFGNKRHDTVFGKKALISTYSEYNFCVNTIYNFKI